MGRGPPNSSVGGIRPRKVCASQVSERTHPRCVHVHVHARPCACACACTRADVCMPLCVPCVRARVVRARARVVRVRVHVANLFAHLCQLTLQLHITTNHRHVPQCQPGRQADRQAGSTVVHKAHAQYMKWSKRRGRHECACMCYSLRAWPIRAHTAFVHTDRRLAYRRTHRVALPRPRHRPDARHIDARTRMVLPPASLFRWRLADTQTGETTPPPCFAGA